MPSRRSRGGAKMTAKTAVLAADTPTANHVPHTTATGSTARR
jgi:hypothetical protein